MFSKKHSKPQTQIDSLIGAGTSIDGDVNFSGGMRIDGQVNGNVVAAQGKPSTAQRYSKMWLRRCCERRANFHYRYPLGMLSN